MANPQPDKYTKISNELYEAIMQTDFNKRQRKMLDLIIRVSYGCGKKYALLRPSDFEVVGVYKTHVKKELDYLVMTKVIIINGDKIAINKNYEQWRISLNKTVDKEKFKEIISRNLVEKVTKTVTAEQEQVTETVTKVTETVTPEIEEVTKTVTQGYQNGNYSYQNSNHEVTKTVTDSYQNSNFGVTKTVTEQDSKANDTNVYSLPKENIKENIKENTPPIVPPKGDGDGDGEVNPFKFYEENFGVLAPYAIEKIKGMIDDIGPVMVVEAMKIAVKNRARGLRYVETILRRWRDNNIRKPEQIYYDQTEWQYRGKPPDKISAVSKTVNSKYGW